MSKYVPYAQFDLSDIVYTCGLDFLANNCSIFVGKTSPDENIAPLTFTKLSELMPYYSHMVYQVFTDPVTHNPQEIWIAKSSLAVMARAEGKPIPEWENIDSLLALETNAQREKEETEYRKANL